MNPVLVLLLSPLAGLYWIGLCADRWWRRRQVKTLPKPVISIGNLTVGGTGKTPFLIYMAQHLISRVRTPAVLTRGYAGMGVSKKDSAENDESLLLKRRCPGVLVGIGADRWKSARTLMSNAVIDAFLLDDGFQHWDLNRKLDFVCIDATDPWGGGALLPAGRLREPRTALRRAQAIVVNRMELLLEPQRRALREKIKKIAGEVPVFVSEPDYRLIECSSGSFTPLAALHGQTVLALSAVGNPLAFERTLVSFGANVQPARFPDHHAYTLAEIQARLTQARISHAMVIVTEKDWVKIEPLLKNAIGLYVLQLSLDFPTEQQEQLEALVKSVVT